MSQLELHILVGIPGSGKTTRAEALVRLGFVDVIISSDEIRFKHIAERSNPYDDPYFVPELEPEVWAEFKATVRKALEEGKTPLLDGTNLNPTYRQVWMDLAKEFNAKPVAHVLLVPFEECDRRNQGRERQVPFEVVQKMYDDFEEGCDVELLLREGWSVRSYTLDTEGSLKIQ